jgi:hypothetical protein
VAAVIPVEEEVPAVESIPSVGHGTVLNVELGAVGFRVGSVAIGLRPPAPSSVEPSGTPRRPTAVEPIPEGDEAEDPGLPIELPVVTGHVPDAVPAMPAPSNTDVDPEVPAAEVPVPSDVPAIELPIPEDVPGAEFSTPKDACGTEPPMPPQVELIPNAGIAFLLRPEECGRVEQAHRGQCQAEMSCQAAEAQAWSAPRQRCSPGGARSKRKSKCVS